MGASILTLSLTLIIKVDKVNKIYDKIPRIFNLSYLSHLRSDKN